LDRCLHGMWRFSTSARVGDGEVAHAQIMVTPEAGK
jgi:hypothetical protein